GRKLSLQQIAVVLQEMPCRGQPVLHGENGLSLLSKLQVLLLGKLARVGELQLTCLEILLRTPDQKLGLPLIEPEQDRSHLDRVILMDQDLDDSAGLDR